MALIQQSYSSLPSDRQKSFIQRDSDDFIPPMIPPANSPISLPSCTTSKSVTCSCFGKQASSSGREG